MTRHPIARRIATSACAVALAAAAAPTGAQSVYAAGGTQGLTLGTAQSLSERWGGRLEATVLPTTSYSFVDGGIDYRGEVRVARAAGLADWHPWGGSFRLVGGLSGGRSEGEFSGRASSSGLLTVGDVTVLVSPADAYAVTVKFPAVMPYLGVGWGHLPQRGWGFIADVGVQFGRPKVTGELSASLRAKIVAAGRDPDVELDRELDAVRDGIGGIQAFPVASIGVSYRW